MWRGGRCGGKPLRQWTAMLGNPERLRNGFAERSQFMQHFQQTRGSRAAPCRPHRLNFLYLMRCGMVESMPSRRFLSSS
jgi:hypothetical protein